MKRSVIMVVITMMFIILLSYQPPVDGNAQQLKKEVTPTIHFDTVNLEIDRTLFDSIRIYRLKADSLKSECRSGLGTIKRQQKIVNKQIKVISTFTVKN